MSSISTVFSMIPKAAKGYHKYYKQAAPGAKAMAWTSGIGLVGMLTSTFTGLGKTESTGFLDSMFKFLDHVSMVAGFLTPIFPALLFPVAIYSGIRAFMKVCQGDVVGGTFQALDALPLFTALTKLNYIKKAAASITPLAGKAGEQLKLVTSLNVLNKEGKVVEQAVSVQNAAERMALNGKRIATAMEKQGTVVKEAEAAMIASRKEMSDGIVEIVVKRKKSIDGIDGPLAKAYQRRLTGERSRMVDSMAEVAKRGGIPKPQAVQDLIVETKALNKAFGDVIKPLEKQIAVLDRQSKIAAKGLAKYNKIKASIPATDTAKIAELEKRITELTAKKTNLDEALKPIKTRLTNLTSQRKTFLSNGRKWADTEANVIYAENVLAKHRAIQAEFVKHEAEFNRLVGIEGCVGKMFKANHGIGEGLLKREVSSVNGITGFMNTYNKSEALCQVTFNVEKGVLATTKHAYGEGAKAQMQCVINTGRSLKSKGFKPTAQSAIAWVKSLFHGKSKTMDMSALAQAAAKPSVNPNAPSLATLALTA